jgi:hypothetical protein
MKNTEMMYNTGIIRVYIVNPNFTYMHIVNHNMQQVREPGGAAVQGSNLVSLQSVTSGTVFQRYKGFGSSSS